MSVLTINDLKPDHLYQVVDPGSKPTRFITAFVIGAEDSCPFKAVTVRMPDGIGIPRWRGVGTTWGAEDTGARFVSHYGPLVLMNPVQTTTGA